MSKVKLISSLSQLEQFANEKGILEIAIRGKHKRFKAFQKITLDNLVQNKDIASKFNNMFNQLNLNNGIDIRNMQLLNNVAQLNNLNLLMNGLNLCASCVGFAIISYKIDEMSEQIKEVLSVIKTTNNLQLDHEFRKCVSEHEKMLDHRKTGDYFLINRMEDLVANEYNVLELLIKAFMGNIISDKETLLYSIMALASMFATSLKYYDEMYYFKYTDKVINDNSWHMSHAKWLSVFDKIASVQFVNVVQDYGVFTLNLPVLSSDAFFMNVADNALSYKQDVIDNQALLLVCDNDTQYNSFMNIMNEEVKYAIYKAVDQEENICDDINVMSIIDKGMKQVGIMA